MLPVQWQIITWTNVDMLSIISSSTNLSEAYIQISQFSIYIQENKFENVICKMSFCSGLDVLSGMYIYVSYRQVSNISRTLVGN